MTTRRPDQRAAQLLEAALTVEHGDALESYSLYDERHTRDCYVSSWEVDIRRSDRVVATRRALVYLHADGTSEVML